MSFSMGKRDSIFDLNRVATNKSVARVGGFKIRKDLSFNPNGEVIYTHTNFDQRQDDFSDLDNVMFANSKKFDPTQLDLASSTHFQEDRLNGLHPVGSVPHGQHDAFGLPCQMTNSQDIEMNKSGLKEHSILSKSLMGKRFGGDEGWIESSSIGPCPSNLYTLNISQLMQDPFLKTSMATSFRNMPNFSLIDPKLETKSEPDYETTHMDEFIPEIQNISQQVQNIQQQQVLGLDKDTLSHFERDNGTSGQSNDNFSFAQRKVTPMTESSGQVGMTIDPFAYSQNSQYPLQYPHSDDEENDKQKKPIKIQSPKGSRVSKNPAKGSQYRQSRHKNVFKNFGGTLVRFIIYNQHFQNRVIQELGQNAVKKQAFQQWLQNDVKLERKKDFQIAWTTFKSDSEELKEHKALLRELSRDFFENFSFIYLINSKKISDIEIHLRSIHTYLVSINNPDTLGRFKPV